MGMTRRTMVESHFPSWAAQPCLFSGHVTPLPVAIPCCIADPIRLLSLCFLTKTIKSSADRVDVGYLHLNCIYVVSVISLVYKSTFIILYFTQKSLKKRLLPMWPFNPFVNYVHAGPPGPCPDLVMRCAADVMIFNLQTMNNV